MTDNRRHRLSRRSLLLGLSLERKKSEQGEEAIAEPRKTVSDLAKRLEVSESTLRQYIRIHRTLFHESQGIGESSLDLDTEARLEAVREFMRPASHEKLRALLEDPEYRKRYIAPLLRRPDLSPEEQGSKESEDAERPRVGLSEFGSWASIAGLLLGGYALARQALSESQSAENLDTIQALLEDLEETQDRMIEKFESKAGTGNTAEEEEPRNILWLAARKVARLAWQRKDRRLTQSLCDAYMLSAKLGTSPAEIVNLVEVPDALLFRCSILVGEADAHELIRHIGSHIGRTDPFPLLLHYNEIFSRRPHLFANDVILSFGEAISLLARNVIGPGEYDSWRDMKKQAPSRWEVLATLLVAMEEELSEPVSYLKRTCGWTPGHGIIEGSVKSLLQSVE